MLYTIQNHQLTVTVHTRGAELQSIKSNDGTEYLWQGDPAYWEDRSPNLFPYIGRTINRRYAYAGKEYGMNIHGFAPYLDFELASQSADSLTFRLCDSEQTRPMYPWKFCYEVEYKLTGNRLAISYIVSNLDEKTMLFAVGGHPGINIPLTEGERFEDYRIRFSEPSEPERILFTPDCYVEDHTVPYPLDESNSIPLCHSLFDDEAVVLKNTAKTVTLENIHGGRSVTATFPQMAYIGFWHEVKLDAPYVCIEPWSSLPSPKGEKTVLEEQADLLSLVPGKTYINRWEMCFR